jgi:glycosyltransferase involved in cell wall biosynthesis
VKLAAGAAATVRPRAPVARSGAPREDAASGLPRVAVIIPCFNDGTLALEAVASVEEDEPVEVVVVDDASTEPETAAALDALRERGVTVLRHEVNRGLSAARRTGLAATSAPYVFPLDSDDLLVKGALKRLADRLDAEPGAAAAYGDTQEFGTRSRLDTKPVALDAYRVAFRNRYPVCSLFRRPALVAAGAWQDVGGMVGYEDWALWMTLAERGERAVHVGPGFVAVRYRLHGPRMYGDAAARHRRLYAELRRSHPQLFAELGRHRRASPMGPVRRVTYPWLFGDRPPLGLRARLSALSAAYGRTPFSDAS